MSVFLPTMLFSLFENVATAGGSYVLPEPPALVILDQRGATFDEPSAATDFAVSAGELLGEDGVLTPGGAMELSPRALGVFQAVTYERYQTSPAIRVLSRTFLSLATAESTAVDVPGVGLGVGLRSVLFRGSDPLLDPAYAAKVDAVEARCTAAGSESGDAGIAAWQACLEEESKKLSSTVVAPPWNAAGLVASSALSVGFPAGKLGKGQVDALGGWLSFAGPLGPLWQGGVSAGWRQRHAPMGGRLECATMARGGGGRSRLKTEIGLQIPFNEQETLGIPMLIGGEFQVDSSAWLNADFGVQLSPASGAVALLSGLRFQWGQTREATIGEP
jgi:hypothetical protein